MIQTAVLSDPTENIIVKVILESAMFRQVKPLSAGIKGRWCPPVSSMTVLLSLSSSQLSKDLSSGMPSGRALGCHHDLGAPLFPCASTLTCDPRPSLLPPFPSISDNLRENHLRPLSYFLDSCVFLGFLFCGGGLDRY